MGTEILTWALMGLRAGLDFSDNLAYMGVTCKHPSSNILSISDFHTDLTRPQTLMVEQLYHFVVGEHIIRYLNMPRHRPLSSIPSI